MRLENPFRVTKSNDLTDEQIEQLWVSITEGDESTSLISPASPIATYILGGKGSGKSHLLRYYSFPVQLMRYRKNSDDVSNGIKRDGYLGIYARCGGMDSSRFSGKAIVDEKWSSLFIYYFELWTADKTLAAMQQLVGLDVISREAEEKIVRGIGGLLDRPVTAFNTIEGARAYFSELRRTLDYAVNNVAFTGELNAEVLVTRGRLFFELPKILCTHVDALRDVTIVYLLDELENFSTERQIYINTLLREREGPTAFRIGSRLYGRRTLSTLSAGERNLRDSEYEDKCLDERFRQSASLYKDFAIRLVSRRLNPFSERKGVDAKRSIDATGVALCDQFECPDLDWDSRYISDIAAKQGVSERRHHQILRGHLERGVAEGLVVGVAGATDIENIIRCVTFPEHPILEKLCILGIYQRWFRSADVVEAAKEFQRNASVKLQGIRNKKFDEFVDKHKSDMVAQWFRENSQKQIYAGLDNFIQMSEGLPRSLITILKHVYDWASYTGEEPFRTGRISVASQQKGVAEAADLFLEQMLPDGEDGVRVGKAIERLCILFRINRFSDKPVETSLIAFSVDLLALSTEARYVIDLATKTSLLVVVEGGQRDRNSKVVNTKLEINRMLAPRRDLPIARRGIVPFDPQVAETVFGMCSEEEFDAVAKAWEEKMSAPAFGKQGIYRNRTKKHPDLFE